MSERFHESCVTAELFYTCACVSVDPWLVFPDDVTSLTQTPHKSPPLNSDIEFLNSGP